MGTTTVRVWWNVLSLGATGDQRVWWPIRSVIAWNSWEPVGWSGWRLALTRRSEKYPRQLATPHILRNKCGMWSHKITEQMEAYKYAQDQKHCTERIILAFLCLLRRCRLKWETHHFHRKHKSHIFVHAIEISVLCNKYETCVIRFPCYLIFFNQLRYFDSCGELLFV